MSAIDVIAWVWGMAMRRMAVRAVPMREMHMACHIRIVHMREMQMADIRGIKPA